MLTSTARRLDDSDTAHSAPQARAWRPFPVEVSDVLCVESPEGEIGPWMHARFAITLVPAGAVVRLESRRSIRLQNDAVLLVPELHMYAVRPRETASSVGVTLLVGQRDVTSPAKNSAPALVTQSDLVASTSEVLAELSGHVRPIGGASCVVTRVERLVAESTGVALGRTSTAATPLLPLRDYLRAHLSELVPTATLAEMSGLTESHFIRAFHHEFGLPPHAYHMRLRLAEASELLSRGQSVSTVAYDCGFADQSHLSRKFKEVYGIAPGAWGSAAAGRGNSGRGTRGEGRGMRDASRGTREAGRWTRDAGRGARDAGRGTMSNYATRNPRPNLLMESSMTAPGSR